VRELGELLHELDQRAQRMAAIEAALRQTVQRVNLFEQVLVPRARAEIRAIQVYLADAERTAIVRAKQGRALVHRRMQAQAKAQGERA
jgi:V/A-type H+-transporting ATPase subunit D